jgi:hypothetical protein
MKIKQPAHPGHESKLAYCGNVLIENRNRLVVDTELVLCSCTAERDAALEMAERIEGDQRVTLGADKGYDTRGLVRDLRLRRPTTQTAFVQCPYSGRASARCSLRSST